MLNGAYIEKLREQVRSKNSPSTCSSLTPGGALANFDSETQVKILMQDEIDKVKGKRARTLHCKLI